MTSIIGSISNRDVCSSLLKGLKIFEGREYDLHALVYAKEDKIYKTSVKGSIHEIIDFSDKNSLISNKAIALSRWTTIKDSKKENATLITDDSLNLVYTGNITNLESIKEYLFSQNYIQDEIEEDEIIVSLLKHKYSLSQNLILAINECLNFVEGTFAALIIEKNSNANIYAVKKGLPLIIGFNTDVSYISTDIENLKDVASSFICLEDGDVAKLSYSDVIFFDYDLNQVYRKILYKSDDDMQILKVNFEHFMQKEIYESSKAIHDTISYCVDYKDDSSNLHLRREGLDLSDLQYIKIVACASSYHVALFAKYVIEKYSKIVCDVEQSTEFVTNNYLLPGNSLFIAISQSGETLDTIQAFKHAKSLNFEHYLSISNVKNSSLVKAADNSLITQAGFEYSVVSTKSFVSALCSIMIFSTKLSYVKNVLPSISLDRLIDDINALPSVVNKILSLNDRIKTIALDFKDKQNALFLGSGYMYPIALEGALKFKEIAYIHAEGIAAGELKHGSLAIIDENMPVILVAPNNNILYKIKSYIDEVQERGAMLYVITTNSVDIQDEANLKTIKVDDVSYFASPIVVSIILQLLSYHIALLKGTNVDKPRNLIKAVNN